VPSSLYNPFDTLRSQQVAASQAPRTRDQLTTFPTRFDPSAYPASDVVIPNEVTSTLGLPALTQDLYIKMMTQVPVGPYIPAASNVVLTGDIQNDGTTDTRYEPLVSFQDGTGTAYTVGARLGAGTYGVVHALTSHPDRVVKIAIGDDTSKDGNLLLETFIQLIVSQELQKLRTKIGEDKFIGHYATAAGVHGLSYFTNDGHRYIVLIMDKAATPFHKYLRSKTMNTLQRSTTNAHVTYQMCKTLIYLLQKLQFNHRDMKCDNLMITPSPSLRNSNGVVFAQASLIDFGMSRLVYNGRLFSSNWKTFMTALQEDTHPHPDHDITFFLLSMIWEDGCGLEFDTARSCRSKLQPGFYQMIVTLLCDVDPMIAQKYKDGRYSGDNAATGDPNWWEFYDDAFHAMRDISERTLRSGQTTYTLTFTYMTKVLNDMKRFLREVARNPSTATEPLYFGRRTM
jgi:serine/threonine protein kinase